MDFGIVFGHRGLTLVFVGHPELRRRLGLAEHEALSQRIIVRANVAVSIAAS